MKSNSTNQGDYMEKITKLKELAMERHELSFIQADMLFKANRADELVWQMARVAHELLDMQQEVEALYPEMIPFLTYLIRTYPALRTVQ